MALPHYGRGRPPGFTSTEGGQQSGVEDQEPEHAAAQSEKQERGQGEHPGTVRGERAVRGGRALLLRVPRRRDPPRGAVRGLRGGRRRDGDPPQRRSALQRRTTGTVPKRSTPVRHPYNVVPPRFDPNREIDWSPVWSLSRDRASLAAHGYALQHDARAAREREPLGGLERLCRRKYARGSDPPGIPRACGARRLRESGGTTGCACPA